MFNSRPRLFISQEDGFTVRFPTQPLVHGLPLGKEYLSKSRDKIYSVMVSYVLQEYTKAQRRKELESFVLAMPNATLLSSITDKTPLGEPSTYTMYELTLKNGVKIYRHVRSFFNNGKIYTIMMSVAQPDEEAFAAFMDSFENIETHK
jgi:hypothetical protein